MTTVERISDYPGEIRLHSLLLVLWEYRLLIAACTGVMAIIAMAYALAATPIFRAEVAVTPVEDASLGVAGSASERLGGLASLVGMDLLSGGRNREAVAVLHSRRLVEEFIKKYVPLDDLFRDSSAQSNLWLAVEIFRDDVLAIREPTLDGVTKISMDWNDPNIAAHWANDFVALVNETLRQRDLEESTRNIKYLNEQIAKTNVVELRQVMYNLIETETKTLMLANARPEYAFTIVDPAVPPAIREFPRRTLLVLLGSALGLFLGIAVALFRDAWINRVSVDPAPSCGS
jgi:uncharacterized protein involved in exopolysaccharide biosynthesis